MKDLLKGDLKNISRKSNEELFMDIFSVLCPTYPRAEIVEAYEIIKGNWLLLKVQHVIYHLHSLKSQFVT